jgi:hypothetical protein
MTATLTDARLDNWTYAVPPAVRTLLLPVCDERPANAVLAQRNAAGMTTVLADGPYDGVAAPDLSGWAAEMNRPAAELLAQLAAVVAPGGWIYAGVLPPLCPLRPGGPGALSTRRARRTLHRAGLVTDRCWIVLPSLRRPAFLVPAERSAELDYFLTAIFFPHVESTNPVLGRATRTALRLGRQFALRAPPSARLACAPGAAVLGVRR